MSTPRLAPLLLLLGCAAALVAESRPLLVPGGQTRSEAVNAFRARVEIDGTVDESVFLLGGSLRLAGEVTGDVICIAAEVEIDPAAVIGRDLIVIGGRLQRGEGSRVAGRVYEVHSRRDLRQMAASVLPFLPESGGMTFFKVIKSFFWLLLALLALAAFPAAVTQAAGALPRQPWRHLLRGLLLQLAFALLVLLAALLSLVLVGIPLLILLLAAFLLALIFGRAALFYCIGERLLRALKLSGAAALFVVCGALVYSLLKFVPFVGWPLLVLLDSVAIGVAAGHLIKKRAKAA